MNSLFIELDRVSENLALVSTKNEVNALQETLQKLFGLELQPSELSTTSTIDQVLSTKLPQEAVDRIKNLFSNTILKAEELATAKILSHYEERLGFMYAVESHHETGLTKESLIKSIQVAFSLAIGGQTLETFDQQPIQIHRISKDRIAIFSDRHVIPLGEGANAFIYTLFSIDKARYQVLKKEKEINQILESIPENIPEEVASEVLSVMERVNKKLILLHAETGIDGIIKPSHTIRVFISGCEGPKRGFGSLQKKALCDLEHALNEQMIANLPLIRRLQLCKELLRGLNRMKQLHIMHRDIKASNIFVFQNRDGSFSCRLGDFDEARYIEGKETERTPNGQIDSSCYVYTPSNRCTEEDRALYCYQQDMYCTGRCLVGIMTANESNIYKPDIDSIRLNLLHEGHPPEIAFALIAWAQGLVETDFKIRLTAEQALTDLENILSLQADTPSECMQ